MQVNPRLVGRALALLCATVLWPIEGPSAYPTGDPRLVGAELARLVELNQTLRKSLESEEERLESSCEFTDIRDRLIQVRDAALTGIGRLEAFWREGRLRNGGVALAEVLLNELGGVVEDARRDIAVADTLALIQAQPGEASDLARRTAVVHGEAMACVDAGRGPLGAGQARAGNTR